MFHGKEVRTLEIGGARYRASQFPPAFATRPHAHASPYFCLVLSGASAQTSGGVARDRRRGELFFYPAGEKQSETFGSDGGQLFSIELGSLERVTELGDVPRCSMRLGDAAGTVARRLHAETMRRDSASFLAIEGLTLALCAELLRVPVERAVPPWVSRVREFLQARYATQFALSEVAAVAGVHPVHRSREFPRRFGSTLGDYVRGLRIDDAARALASTDRAIAEVALDAGFSSQAHFSRHFKARTGLTPAVYRANSRSSR